MRGARSRRLMMAGRAVLLLSALAAQCCHGELMAGTAVGHAPAARQRHAGAHGAAPTRTRQGVAAKAAKSTARVNERLEAEVCVPRDAEACAPRELQRPDAAPAAPDAAFAAAGTPVHPDTLPNPPADIDEDSELDDGAPFAPAAAATGADCAQASPGLSAKAAEAASAAADSARQAAQRGMLALSAAWSTCVEQTKQTSRDMKNRARSLPKVAARLVPPSPARKGLQTLMSESASLWAGALFKILMLQVMVIIRTVVSQGNVIARSFIQAANLEPTALVPDSPMLQRQRSRAKALAAKAQAQEARMRMQELQAQIHQTAETLRAAEIASYTYSPQGDRCIDSRQWRRSDVPRNDCDVPVAAGCASGSSSWRGQNAEPQHVTFLDSTGASYARQGEGHARGPATPRDRERRSPSPSHLLMSASRRTPLPASPLPPPTPGVNQAHGF